MRRKSERVKEKDKASEKKVEKSPKKSRRSSRRRKKSSSSSEESETDEYDTSFKSCKDDVEEVPPSGENIVEKNKTTVAEDDTKKAEVATELEGKEHRHGKKYSVDEDEETPPAAEHTKEQKEGSVEEADAVVGNPEKPKESDSKSSVWQVKSADCSGGEINKIKLCIVRPTEVVEPEPRKRKKLSRIPHRAESDTGSGESEERTAHDLQDEKSKSGKYMASVSDESKSEESRHSEKRPKPENSSDEEQHIALPVATPASADTLENKGKSQVSLDTKMKRKHDGEDHIKEDKESSDKSCPDDSFVDSSRSHQETKSAESSDLVKNSKLDTSVSQEQVLVEENTKPSSSTEISTESKETDVSNLQDKSKNVVIRTPLEEESPTVSSSVPQVSSSASEGKTEISELPHTSGKVPDMAESVSNSQESHLEKDAVVSNKSNSNDVTQAKTKSRSISDTKTIIQQYSEKVPASPKKSTSRESSDSEGERLSYRKLQETKKKTHRLTRHTSDPLEKQSEEMASSKTNTSKEETSDDVQHLCKSTSKHEHPSKNIKYEEPKDSLRLERKILKNNENNESTEKPTVKEKISLKRSFSRVIDASSSNLVTTKDVELNVQDGENNESRNIVLDNAPTGSEIQPNPIRKRRWGASKCTTTVKKPTLSISSDSLKHLIPEVKPLPISEVHLTEDEDEEEEEEEGEVLDRVEESFETEPEVITEKRREEGVTANNQPEEKELLYPLPMVPIPPEAKLGTVRKISIVSGDTAHLQRSPSPARHRTTNILYITNLVRPFTVNQLRELLARTGSIVENGFWIDKIKSKCYVQYESETEARETRHALHGVRWPVSNPKQLCVDYAKKEDMDLARDLAEGNHIPRKTEPLKVDRRDGWSADQSRDKGREPLLREDKDKDKDKNKDRERMRGKDRHTAVSLEGLEKNRETKMPISIREWDLGKMDMGSFDDRGFHREERSERERRMRKERSHRSPSREVPGRKIRKKDEEAPAKLLDDLFKKTKFTPCVYWLPLTADQIVVKEEMRRKHMAEHERRMAEMRKAEKAERDRHRARLQSRNSQRRFDDKDRDKRRHRSLSTSPKK